MAAVLERFMSSFEQSLDEFDAREASGEVSLDLPLLDFNHLVIANILYFAVLLALHNFMKSRDAYKLTGFMRFYNVSCVIAAGAVVYGGVVHHFKYQTFQFVGNDNMLDLRQESGRHLRFFMWVYYAQKFWEFLDTVVFILRKSYRQVTFLHIYHHCSITFVTRTFIVYGQSGDMIVPSWLNALVHVFMYSHYLCATFKVSEQSQAHPMPSDHGLAADLDPTGSLYALIHTN
eukprot:TRINITY_DN5647_c0_g1_i2.p1 TRINITY_DN5647_c0_g1~~TRINITY_DN5647_c0_g1_i2.p1  ORF type:complete len:272 (+),score=41.91 TRINITY_DN5647_c0_g1_i2:123-818(+)